MKKLVVLSIAGLLATTQPALGQLPKAYFYDHTSLINAVHAGKVFQCAYLTVRTKVKPMAGHVTKNGRKFAPIYQKRLLALKESLSRTQARSKKLNRSIIKLRARIRSFNLLCKELLQKKGVPTPDPGTRNPIPTSAPPPSQSPIPSPEPSLCNNGAQDASEFLVDCGGICLTPCEGALTPIARWDVVPNQRINSGESLNLAVVAFSKSGIQQVEFIISGQGYKGLPKIASEMTLNPQSGAWEYWHPLPASDFTNDGIISVIAKVYGKDGGLRDQTSGGGGEGLDAMTLTVNPNGSIPQPQAWVDTNGSDSTAQVESESKPFRTIGRAIDAIRQWKTANGLPNNADGGIVRLKPGTHSMSKGGVAGEIPVLNEWVTITTAAGGSRSNTILQHGNGGTPTVKLLKAKGITLKSDRQYDFAIFSGAPDARVWADEADLIGAGQWTDGGYLIANSCYLTNSYLSDTDYPTAYARLARNLFIERVGGDVFQNVPFVVNVRATDINRGPTANHCDAFQLHWASKGPSGNVIIYNYRVDNADSQSIFVADQSNPAFVLNGAAIVNTYINSSMFGQWGVPTNHFVVWHTTILNDHESFILRKGLSNKSVVGNVFQSLLSEPLDPFEAHDNHFIEGSPLGGAASSGEALLDADGRPLSSSPLRQRIDPILVPVDADNASRNPAPADVGSYEFIP